MDENPIEDWTLYMLKKIRSVQRDEVTDVVLMGLGAMDVIAHVIEGSTSLQGYVDMLKSNVELYQLGEPGCDKAPDFIDRWAEELRSDVVPLWMEDSD